MCNHSSPGPQYLAFSTAGSSETSHPDSWWKWGLFLSVIKPFCGKKLILIGWTWLPSGGPWLPIGWAYVLPVSRFIKVGGIRRREQGSLIQQFILRRTKNTVNPTYRVNNPNTGSKIDRRNNTHVFHQMTWIQNNPAQNKGGTTYYI